MLHAAALTTTAVRRACSLPPSVPNSRVSVIEFASVMRTSLMNTSGSERSIVSRRGRIKYYTHPPETHEMPTHLAAEIVSTMSAEFDISSLEAAEQTEFQSMSLRSPGGVNGASLTDFFRRRSCATTVRCCSYGYHGCGRGTWGEGRRWKDGDGKRTIFTGFYRVKWKLWPLGSTLHLKGIGSVSDASSLHAHGLCHMVFHFLSNASESQS